MPTDTPLPTTEQLDALDESFRLGYWTGRKLNRMWTARSSECRLLLAKVAELEDERDELAALLRRCIDACAGKRIDLHDLQFLIFEAANYLKRQGLEGRVMR